MRTELVSYIIHQANEVVPQSHPKISRSFAKNVDWKTIKTS